MNSTASANDLSCFRIVEDERDGAFFVHAYSHSSRQVVEVSHHWDRISAESSLVALLIGRKVRAIAGVHKEIFSVIGTVLNTNYDGNEVRVEFADKVYTCPTAWFSHYFQSML